MHSNEEELIALVGGGHTNVVDRLFDDDTTSIEEDLENHCHEQIYDIETVEQAHIEASHVFDIENIERYEEAAYSIRGVKKKEPLGARLLNTNIGSKQRKPRIGGPTKKKKSRKKKPGKQYGKNKKK